MNDKLVLRRHPIASWMVGILGSLFVISIIIFTVLSSPSTSREDSKIDLPSLLISLVAITGSVAVGVMNPTRIWIFDKVTRIIQYEKFSFYQKMTNRKQIRQYSTSSLKKIEIKDFEHVYDFDVSSYAIVLIFESTTGSLEQISLTDENFDSDVFNKQKTVRELGHFLNLSVQTEPVFASEKISPV